MAHIDITIAGRIDLSEEEAIAHWLRDRGFVAVDREIMNHLAHDDIPHGRVSYDPHRDLYVAKGKI